MVSAWSFAMALPSWILAGGRVSTAPWRDIALQVLWQGGIASLAGLAIYARAIRHLGASRAALSGALVPGSSALAGWVVPGESIDGLAAAGMAATTLGVALAAGLAEVKAAPRSAGR